MHLSGKTIWQLRLYQQEVTSGQDLKTRVPVLQPVAGPDANFLGAVGTREGSEIQQAQENQLPEQPDPSGQAGAGFAGLSGKTVQSGSGDSPFVFAPHPGDPVHCRGAAQDRELEELHPGDAPRKVHELLRQRTGWC